MGIEFNNQQISAIYNLENWWHSQSKQVFEVSGKAGTGKALDSESLIPTPEGLKPLKTLNVGDYVFDRLGNPTEILGVYRQGELNAFKITFEDGRECICNSEHIWTCYDSNNQLFDLTTLQISEMEEIAIPINGAVQFEKNKGKVYFYEVGKLYRSLAYADYKYNHFDYSYACSSFQQRYELLSGIFQKSKTRNYEDTFNIPIVLTTQNKHFIDYIRFILFSLGINSKIITESHSTTVYTLLVSPYPKKNDKKDRVYIKSVELLSEYRDMICLYVDNDEHLFLANDFLVTHNTTLIQYFIERIGLEKNEVLFMAYMGKAASQMTRSGVPAKTIHSAIYEYKEEIARDENNKIILKENGKPKKVSKFVLKEYIPKRIKLFVIDEGSMVDKKMAEDLLSFNRPIIVLGDLNQLPPVFGNSYFLNKPDVILTQIMRQEENNPIVWLADQILEGKNLHMGVYGKSSVIPKKNLSDYHFKKNDIVLTGTNKLRYTINQYFREELKEIVKLEYPHIGEKVICRKNNWNKCIDGEIYLTNGMTGFVDYFYRDSFDKRSLKIDFRPDFTTSVFRNIRFDYKAMYKNPFDSEEEQKDASWYYDKFEYAYAITAYSSQGSQWENVLYLHEDFINDPDFRKKHMYTAITRAQKNITIVI